MLKKWVKDRITERSTLDGVVFVLGGMAFIVFKPIGSLVAYGAIAYGAYTIWRKD